MKQPPRAAVRVFRCAVYTRKSTDQGLEQEFNSLDAQRESAEAYARSQASLGWVVLPERYDDPGCTGANTERAGLQKLLADIRAGKIDVLLVYKIDRLTRSLRDFAKLMELLEQHEVALVSVTQLLNTATPMGRLMLHILLSFAEFERDLISERTRDKMAATRRKGKFAGGTPPLGYDLQRNPSKLVINEEEATLVRAIFALYLEHESLLPVVQELARRQWVNKRWPTANGDKGGQPFTRTSLHRLLTNPVYLGKVRHHHDWFEGEHQPIIAAGIWEQAQALLQRNARTGGAPVRNAFGAFLKGILFCGSCGCAMTPSVTTKKERRYRYYTCVNAQKKGWDTCPTKSIPAAVVEEFVLDQIRGLASDQELVEATLRELRAQEQSRLNELEAERRRLERDLGRWHEDLQRIPKIEGDGYTLRRLADLQEQIRLAERQRSRVREQATILRQHQIDEEEARTAMAAFLPVWEVLTPREKSRLVELIVQQVEFNAAIGTIKVTFHPESIRTLSREMNNQQERA